MEDVKSILLSRTIWGAVLMAVAFVAKLNGYEVDVDGWTTTIIEILGMALTIYGRIVATKKIGITGGNATGASTVRFIPFLFILAILSISLFGCAAHESALSLAAKSLLASKAGLTETALASNSACYSGLLGQMDCDAAREKYKQGQDVWYTAADSFLLYLISTDPDNEANFEAAKAKINNINNDLVRMLADHGLAEAPNVK